MVLNQLVIEQGDTALKRKEIVENFFKTGKLNPLSNVQFGEGGAGHFPMENLQQELTVLFVQKFYKNL